MPYAKGSNLAVKIGDVYDQLEVQEFAGGEGEDKEWLCICRCGRHIIVRQRYLRRSNRPNKCCPDCLPKRKAWNKHAIQVGYKFGELEVVEDLGHRKEWGGNKYRCRCICGRERELTAYHLLSQRKNSLTCGKRGCRRSAWNNQTVGEISGMFWAHVRNGAKKRGIPLCITKEEAWKLFLKQERRCAISGVLLLFDESYFKYNGTASLDRKDSNKPYVLDNVQWVHKTVNKMKNTLSDEEFIHWCNLISENNKHATSAVQVA